MVKRFFALFAAALLFFSILAQPAFAAISNPPSAGKVKSGVVLAGKSPGSHSPAGKSQAAKAPVHHPPAGKHPANHPPAGKPSAGKPAPGKPAVKHPPATKPPGKHQPNKPGGKPPGSACAAPVQDGTPARPYLICTPEDLFLLHDHPDAHFELRANLDMSGIAWTTVESFSGQLDGKNHTIATLKTEVGLIRNIEQTGMVKNLKLTDADVYSWYWGGILAATNRGTIDHVAISGFIFGRNTVGGIVGHNEGVIRHSRMDGTIQGNYNLGGIASVNSESGVILHSQVNAVITGEANVGGITGTNIGMISHATVKGKIYRAVRYIAHVGGIAGSNGGTIAHSRSFIDIYYDNVWQNTIGLVYGDNIGTVVHSYGHGRLIHDSVDG